MKDLFVVTHAQTVHHIEKNVGGWFDTGLTEQGQQDALFAAVALLNAAREGSDRADGIIKVRVGHTAISNSCHTTRSFN